MCVHALTQDAFEGLEKEEDEDIELEAMTADYEERGGTVLGQSISMFVP